MFNILITQDSACIDGRALFFLEGEKERERERHDARADQIPRVQVSDLCSCSSPGKHAKRLDGALTVAGLAASIRQLDSWPARIKSGAGRYVRVHVYGGHCASNSTDNTRSRRVHIRYHNEILRSSPHLLQYFHSAICTALLESLSPPALSSPPTTFTATTAKPKPLTQASSL